MQYLQVLFLVVHLNELLEGGLLLNLRDSSHYYLSGEHPETL